MTSNVSDVRRIAILVTPDPSISVKHAQLDFAVIASLNLMARAAAPKTRRSWWTYMKFFSQFTCTCTESDPGFAGL
jgi:hypothetical protein